MVCQIRWATRPGEDATTLWFARGFASATDPPRSILRPHLRTRLCSDLRAEAPPVPAVGTPAGPGARRHSGTLGGSAGLWLQAPAVLRARRSDPGMRRRSGCPPSAERLAVRPVSEDLSEKPREDGSCPRASASEAFETLTPRTGSAMCS